MSDCPAPPLPGPRGRRWSDSIGIGPDLQCCDPSDAPSIEFHKHVYYECSICQTMFHSRQAEPLKHHAREHLRARLDDWPSNKDEMAQESYAEDLSIELLEVESELNEAAGRDILGKRP